MPTVRVPKKLPRPRKTSLRTSVQHRSIAPKSASPRIILYSLCLAAVIISIMLMVWCARREFRRSVLASNTRVNVVVLHGQGGRERATFVSIDTRRDQAVALHIDPEHSVYVASGEGSTPSGLITQLRAGEFDKMRALLGYQTGFLADGWVIIPEPVEDWREAMTLSHLWAAESSFGHLDRVGLWYEISRLQPADIRSIASATVLQRDEDVLENVISERQAREQFGSLLSERELLSQGVALAVVNTTQLTGIATRIGQVFSDIGFQIINISSVFDTPQEQTVLYVKEQSSAIDNDVLESIQQLFPFPIAIQQDREIVEKYRADIVLLLGSDNIFFQSEK